MKFSVVGLPHYTIWHLYEPSLDDIRHMEEMERERKAREEEEKLKAERANQIKEQFDDPKGEFEKDGSAINEIKMQDQQEGSEQQDQQQQQKQQPRDQPQDQPQQDQQGDADNQQNKESSGQ